MPTVQPIQQKPVIDEKELELQVRNSPIYVLSASHRNFFCYGFKQLSSLSVVSLVYRRPLPSVKKKKIGERGPFPDFVLREGSVCTQAKCRVISEKGTSWAGCFRTFTTFMIYLYFFTCFYIYFKNQQQQLKKESFIVTRIVLKEIKFQYRSIISSVAVVSVSVNRSGRSVTREERTKTRLLRRLDP